MAQTKKPQKMQVKIVKADDEITKATATTQRNPESVFNANDWVTQPADLRGLKGLVDNSTILPQCIRAYKNNIAGFGIGVKYKEDVEETEEMAKEYDRLTKILELLNTEEDTKEVFEDVVEARETYGIAYLEVIRNLAGEVVQIDFVKDTPSITKTTPLNPYIITNFYHDGEVSERKKKYCKYRQDIGAQTVYFKEFGDPRIMDNRTGKYVSPDNAPTMEYRANEILEFAIGTMPYGQVRWVGQILGIDGSHKAENLNNNYFVNGRHTPLMIMIENGTLSDESYNKLQMYMNDIKGENGQHAFIILETEGMDTRTDFEASERPSVQIKDFANVLQKDELFQDYLDNHRRKVQSAFQLPDLYVGYTTDFNRATAQTAQEVTEKQVFQPERKSLAWVINNRLLNEYNFKYVEAYFKEPNISNPDDNYKMLTVLNSAGGLTMNKAKDLLYNLYGETSEDYDGDWGNLPLSMAQGQLQQETQGGIQDELQKQIEKASSNNDTEIVAVMKEIKKLLKSEDDDHIIKWDDDLHPRDENGRFTGGGFGGASADTFAEAIVGAKDSLKKEIAWRVETPDASEIDKEHPGSRMYVSPGGSTISVDQAGNIWGVCKERSDSTRGSDLLKMAVENGGIKLDSYDGNHDFYTKNGFEPVSWCKWDGQYAPSDWKSAYGEENIIFYKYTGCTKETATYKTAQEFYDAVPACTDYDSAEKVRDDAM